MIPVIAALLLLFALIYGPQYWVSRVLRHYSLEQDHYPGSGGELAEHLVNTLGLQGVKVEQTELGDHYDPIDKAVRLSEQNFKGKSLTAITVAAHEVGHAIQHQLDYMPFKMRQHLVVFASGAEKLGAFMMFALPVMVLVSRSPHIGLGMFIIGIGSLLLGTIVHLVTLPVEWDASFKRALPILQEGRYISALEQQHAKKILTAAALTYVSASLASLLNLARWIAILRR
ncbi:zinc metallopeptidase [Sulfuriflexus mobilis]|uniref:zinc metallopeptidase n=1 Tax=Sulfuriflexus mobilis TaxID=1811807 RepID=UPI000F83836A|nr:zinc metallopeptidase [Sulfuriflexus mobilis]